MARKATVLIEARTSDARQELAQLEGDLEGVEVAAVGAGDGFSRLSSNASQELSETRTEARRTAAAMDQVSTSARGSANSLGIELTQAAQDASFGVAGVANQIPQLQMEFQRLRSQTGSTTGALASLGSAFAGPTGVLAAGTLLLQFLPQIQSAFTNTAESAAETSKAVEDLKSATDNLISGFEDELPSFEITNVEEVERQIRGLEKSITAREETLGDLREALGAEGAEQAQLSAGAAQFADLQDETIRSLIEQNQRRIRQERTLSRALSEQLDSREDEVDQAELLRNTQGVVVDESEERSQNAQDSADATEREAQAMNALAVSAQQAAENRAVVSRFLAQRGQTRLESQINSFGAGRTPTIGGTMLNQGRSQGDLMLQAARDAGFISQFGTLQDTLGTVGQAAQSAENDVKQSVNQELQRGVNLASQIGTTLIRAARRGGVEFEQAFGTILSAVGATLSAIPGVGTIAGPILGGAGQLISAFDQGGVVDTPLQVVGESGPELAALPQGTRVSTARETERMLSRQQVNVNVTGEIRRLRSRELGLILREDETRRNQFGYSS